jgi:hypothetical protein
MRHTFLRVISASSPAALAVPAALRVASGAIRQGPGLPQDGLRASADRRPGSVTTPSRAVEALPGHPILALRARRPQLIWRPGWPQRLPVPG